MKYFEVGNVSRRELYDALKTAGGLSPWNPTTEPTKIIAGVYSSPGSFVLGADFNGVIDDVSSSSKGTIIYFFQDTKRWGIISGEDKNKGVFQTLSQLQTAYPTATNGDYALIVETGTFFAYYNSQWNNTASNDGNKINVIATDVASASTVNLDNATGDIVNITGTTAITAITLSAGIKRFVRFAGILTLTNGASLVLPSGANIITAVGDTAIFIGYASGVVRCVSYTKANGTALVGGGGAYALLESPAFTGTPTAPTAALNTNTNQLATTAFVIAQITAMLPAGPPQVRILATNIGPQTQAQLQAYYDAQPGNSAPDTPPTALPAYSGNGYEIYLGNNAWYYRAGNDSWFGFGSGFGKGDFGAPIAKLMTYK